MLYIYNIIKGNADALSSRQKIRLNNMKTELATTITNQIIAHLKDHQIKEVSNPWVNFGGMPKNLFTGNHYTGCNVILLAIASQINGFSSRLWLTFNQAKQMGGMVRKGEKGTQAMMIKPMYFDANGEKCEPANAEKTIPFINGFHLFNTDQIDGLEIELNQGFVWEPSEKAQEVIEKTGAKIYHGGDMAYYSQTTDTITMPLAKQFKEDDGYYRTMFHELAHWTGHKSRLARVQDGARYSEAWVMEELVAEIASAFICAQIGFEARLSESVEYIALVIEFLQKDHNAIIKAASAAQKAADYILGDLLQIKNVSYIAE